MTTPAPPPPPQIIESGGHSHPELTLGGATQAHVITQLADRVTALEAAAQAAPAGSVVSAAGQTVPEHEHAGVATDDQVAGVVQVAIDLGRRIQTLEQMPTRADLVARIDALEAAVQAQAVALSGYSDDNLGT